MILVTKQSTALSSNTFQHATLRNAQNCAENRKRSVLTLGFFSLPYYTRTTTLSNPRTDRTYTYYTLKYLSNKPRSDYGKHSGLQDKISQRHVIAQADRERVVTPNITYESGRKDVIAT